MDQINIFDMLFPKYKITKPIRLVECFAGIGSQAKSLERLQKEFRFDFEHYKVIEFDRYAMKSYNVIHGTNFETSDITKIHASDLNIVETDKFDYIMTYSFPCQDLSLAGKRKGMSKGSNTRSGLLWEVKRLLDECNELPQILLMENVPQVISSTNMDNFHMWQKKLEDIGYSNYVSLLNAKDYGIPQNRNRCFMVSILGQCNYSFPKSFDLKLRLKDMLENEVDDRYYLSSEKIEYMRNTAYVSSSFDRMVHNEDGVCSTLCARDYKDPKCVEIKTCKATDKLASKRKLCDKMLEQGHLNEFDMIRHSYTSNRMDDISRKESTDGISATITTRADTLGVVDSGLRIRKLTPLECWRLMGFDDEDFYKAAKVNSNSQLYKQAGNSIVVDVLYYIFREFFI